jgi:hypothetical protein
MTLHRLRPAMGALLAGALLAGCATGSTDSDTGSAGDSPGTSAAEAPVDADDLEPTADWLADEVGRNGFVEGPYIDHGLSLDFATVLADVGGHDDVVGRILDAMQDPREIEGYLSFYDEEANGQYAGATAKLVHTVVTADRDVADYRDDLVEDLTAMVVSSGAEAGRAKDTGEQDYSNTVSQAFVARALAITDDDDGSVTPAVEFLLEQQCDAGWFRESLAGEDGDHSCEGGPKGDRTPSVDATAHAVAALVEVREQLEGELQQAADEAVEAASQWLEESQGDQGGHSVSGGDQPANANSTGLAVRALAAAGRDEAAAAGAGWLLQHRVSGDGPLADEAGAVTFDDRTLRQARRKGISDGDRPQWQRATVEAAAGLHAVAGG